MSCPNQCCKDPATLRASVQQISIDSSQYITINFLSVPSTTGEQRIYLRQTQSWWCWTPVILGTYVPGVGCILCVTYSNAPYICNPPGSWSFCIACHWHQAPTIISLTTPVRITSSISRGSITILEAIHTGVVWVWERDYQAPELTLICTHSEGNCM